VNQFIVAALAEEVDVMETTREFLDRRAGDAKPKDLLRYITQGGARAAGRIGPSVGQRDVRELLPAAETEQQVDLWYGEPVRLSQVNRVHIDANIVRATLEALQRFGAQRLEGLVLWLGDIDADRAHVVRAVVPEQQAISNENGVGYFVSGETLFKLNQSLSESGLRLIAQIHSHPGEAYHSEADDRYAIVTADGGLSLVVPDFGRAPADPTMWAVYRLSNGRWQELSSQQARRLLRVEDGQ
jgi:hypothetical protein